MHEELRKGEKNALVMRHAHDLYATFKKDNRGIAIKPEGFDDKTSNITQTGAVQAKAVGDFIRENDFPVDLVILADCTRVEQTFENLKLDVPEDRILKLSELYEQHNDPKVLSDLFQLFEVDYPEYTDAKNILVIGHKEGTPAFVEQCTTPGMIEAVPAKDYPHAALSIMSFDYLESWRDIKMELGRLHVVAPDKDGNIQQLNGTDFPNYGANIQGFSGGPTIVP